MNLDNFIVRLRRRLVETCAKREAWEMLAPEALSELSHGFAGLPAELDPEGEEAKRFDLLVLDLHSAKLRAEPDFVPLCEQVMALAALLEEPDQEKGVAAGGRSYGGSPLGGEV